MDAWYERIAAESWLSDVADQQLRELGYIVVKDVIPESRRAQLAEAYDLAVSSAHPDDVGKSSSNTRVWDFVDRNPIFDDVYVYKPLLSACCRLIGRPFKLSTMHARAVEPVAKAQVLHADFRRDAEAEGWPMVGFILMIDPFTSENGATRFVPGSHLFSYSPKDVMEDTTGFCKGEKLATGPAGSMIVYNGSVWHGFTANRSEKARRSIQGAYIARDETGWFDGRSARIGPETLARISPLAKYLLNTEQAAKS